MVPKITTLPRLVFVPWTIELGKKASKLHHTVRGQNFLSPHQLTLEWAEGVAVDPLSLQKSNRKPWSKKLIANVSTIFLLPVFAKSVICNDFRAIVHSISAREGGNTICWKAMVRNRSFDDSVTYWFPWKHPMAR